MPKAAPMDGSLKISYGFPDDLRGNVSPSVTSVCCFPLNDKRIGHCSLRHFWALEYHAKNAGTVFFDDGRRLLREPGSIHLYAAGSNYGEDTTKADLPIQETYWVFVGGECCGLERFVDNPERFARFQDPENLIGSLMLSSADLCNDYGNGAYWLVQSLFMKALHILNAARPAGGSDHVVSSAVTRKSFSFQVEQYLRRNFTEGISLASIACYMKTSPSRLSHKFKQETGLSPMTKLTEIRIEHAKSLLMKGEKLKTIAEMTAHSSEYHLSKNFKAVTGVPPAQFRKQHL